MHLLTRLSAALVLGLSLSSGAQAQGLFSPAILVDDKVITGYEIEQRARMLQLLNAPGDPMETARQQLIDDRLRLNAAQDAGIRPSPEDVLDGMAEFAARANLEREEFVAALEARGVAEQTFRDFVQAGLSWRILVQQRFAGRANVSEDEIDRALTAQGGSSVRVLLSEIIMPMTPQNQEEVRARAARIAELDSTAAFSAEARRYSATATRGNGGRLPWQDLTELPPPLRPIVLGLKPGEVSEPIPLQGAIALFQLREIEETGFAAPESATIEYAAYYMPGGRSPETLAKARVLESTLDRCDDLYGVAKGQPAEVLERGSLPPEQIPTDIAFELSKLDPGEVSTALTRANGQTLVFLMLCGRSPKLSDDLDRESFGIGLRNQRIESLAASYLEQLRSDSVIIEK
ncbi:peptidylprolyl isomerase [Thetidibacter halocola]|uniref:Parvulin-like PPIase n=1 Tax=Thetidibacter halocola TaxID=2827239 RepID=A0A8J7WFJ3_9RHOB|nr:peptidylprolyl isomerase [Thetidibacter halocola]MBS0124224.1 peptidylprolyl isomerase [Thetidibacter halocola]